MKSGVENVEAGVRLAEEDKASLDMIVAASDKALDMVQRIAVAAEEQSSAADEVSRSMENILVTAKSSSESVAQIKEASADIARLSSELQRMVAWFRT